MKMDIDIIQSFGTAGVMIYGEAPHDASTKEQCMATLNYIETTLGPQVLASQQATATCRAAQCSGNGNCARAIEFERMAPRDTRCVCDKGFTGEKCNQYVQGVDGLHRLKTDDESTAAVVEVIHDHCCQPVARADCWGFTAGQDNTASIQAAIDCPLAHTVIIKTTKGMAPWIVSPQREPELPLNSLQLRQVRAAMIFSRSDQTIIFEPGVVVLAKRWSFHGMNDNFGYIGGGHRVGHPNATLQNFNTCPRNITIIGYGAVWRMWKHDYRE